MDTDMKEALSKLQTVHILLNSRNSRDVFYPCESVSIRG